MASLDQLRSQASSWNLGADKQLLGFLQEFSQSFLGKTKALQEELDDLVYETKGAELKINNAFNEFLMLSNSQFLENVSLESTSKRTCLCRPDI